jgi:hypothetical protein
MTVDAVFGMNRELESQLNHDMFSQLVHILNDLYQSPNTDSASISEAIVREEEQSLLDIARQARAVSFSIQHDITSCRLMVSAASAKEFDVLGTYAFGLERIIGSEHIFLLETKVISPSLFVP